VYSQAARELLDGWAPDHSAVVQITWPENDGVRVNDGSIARVHDAQEPIVAPCTRQAPMTGADRAWRGWLYSRLCLNVQSASRKASSRRGRQAARRESALESSWPDGCQLAARCIGRDAVATNAVSRRLLVLGRLAGGAMARWLDSIYSLTRHSDDATIPGHGCRHGGGPSSRTVPTSRSTTSRQPYSSCSMAGRRPDRVACLP